MSEPVPSGDTGASIEAEDRLFGQTPQGQAASRLLVALARAARSFLLYDSANTAIRHFLQALRDAADAYFGTHGDLTLEVRPWELVQAGDVVYVDRDRERSLAFRLFRDGVRRLVLTPGVNFHELLRFLEIISVRYTGLRSTEDDMVVLLWKAGFQFIEVEAVEGLVAEDDADASGLETLLVGVPEDFDLPCSVPPGGGALAWAEVPEEALAALAAEDQSAAVPTLCLRLVGELTEAVRPVPPLIPYAEVLPALRELRDFLLGEGTIQPLLGTVRLLKDLHLEDPADREAHRTLVESLADAGSLARLLRSVPREALEAGPEIVELLSLLPGDHLRTLVTVLAIEKGEAARRAARSIIETYTRTRLPWMLDQLARAEADVASELLRAIAHASVGDGLTAAERVVQRGDIEVQFEVLHVVGRAPLGPVMARLCAALVGSQHATIRARAVELVRDRAVQGAFRAMVEYVKRAAITELDPIEAQGFGEAMAKADTLGAMGQFREWCKPPGMFTLVLPQHVRLHYVAVAGLALLPGDDAERMITAVKAKADADLQRFIVAAMIRRRRVGRGGPG